jgi:hypothetical protein
MQSQPKSPDFAPVIGLGAFVSEHTPPPFNRIVNVLFGAGFFLSAPILCLLAAWIAYDTYINRGWNRVDDSGAILPLICGVIFLPLGAWMLFNTFRNWSNAVALYEGGFALKDRKGVRTVKWTDIDAVWQNVTRHYTNMIYTGTTYLYTVQLSDKTKLTLDNKYPKIEEVGKAITNGSANAIFPKYAASINSGQRVNFGILGLDRNGMYFNNKSLTWQEIKAVKISQGIISVKKDGGWFNWATVTVAQIPNFWVFVDLVSRFTKLE